MKVIMIAGMHRSGTSLLANMFHDAGLYLGSKLMKGGFDNVKGHYEDLELLSIHENDLKLKKLHPNGLRLKHNTGLFFEQSSLNDIKKILIDRKNLEVWGWKEPRSTLYIQEWKQILPDLKVVAIYRPANQVIDSLVRRNYKSIFKKNQLRKTNRLLHIFLYPFYLLWEIFNYRKAWAVYNDQLVKFNRKYPEDIYIIGIDQLINDYTKITKHISSKFKLSIKFKTINIFDKTLLNNQPNRFIKFFINNKIKKLEKQLRDATK
jgi:hypothetical protein